MQFKELASRVDGSPLAHFHGPLTVEASTINWKLPPNLSLHRGTKPTDLRAHVGTMDAQKRCWVVVRTHDSKSHLVFPQGVHPFVDVEFPSKAKTDPPIKRRYPLADVCYPPIRRTSNSPSAPTGSPGNRPHRSFRSSITRYIGLSARVVVVGSAGGGTRVSPGANEKGQ